MTECDDFAASTYIKLFLLIHFNGSKMVNTPKYKAHLEAALAAVKYFTALKSTLIAGGKTSPKDYILESNLKFIAQQTISA